MKKQTLHQKTKDRSVFSVYIPVSNKRRKNKPVSMSEFASGYGGFFSQIPENLYLFPGEKMIRLDIRVGAEEG